MRLLTCYTKSNYHESKEACGRSVFGISAIKIRKNGKYTEPDNPAPFGIYFFIML